MKYDEKDPAQRIIALEAKIQRQRSELKSKQLRIIDLDGRAEFFCREWKRLGGGDENVELLQSRARITKLESELAEARAMADRYQKADDAAVQLLEKAKMTLEIPAAEYVPAISDAWQLIENALEKIR